MVTVEESGAENVAWRRYDFGDGDVEFTQGDEGLTTRRRTHVYNEEGDYVIEVQVTNEDGCMDLAQSEVQVHRRQKSLLLLLLIFLKKADVVEPRARKKAGYH